MIYVCGDQAVGDRVREIAAGRGLQSGRGGGLRVETLAAIRGQAVEAWAARGEKAAVGGGGDG